MNNKDIIDEALIRAMEKGFHLVSRQSDGIAMKKDDLAVILSYSLELDDNKWLHVSYSHSKKLPSYNTTKLVKDIFIGNRKAIMIFPEDKEFVNIHPFCLHLFSCITEDPLPDFTRGSDQL